MAYSWNGWLHSRIRHEKFMLKQCTICQNDMTRWIKPVGGWEDDWTTKFIRKSSQGTIWMWKWRVTSVLLRHLHLLIFSRNEAWWKKCVCMSVRLMYKLLAGMKAYGIKAFLCMCQSYVIYYIICRVRNCVYLSLCPSFISISLFKPIGCSRNFEYTLYVRIQL